MPQANRLDRVVERVRGLRAARPAAQERDGLYYAQAARILGLLDDVGRLTPSGIAVCEADDGAVTALLAVAFSQSAVGARWVAFGRVASLPALDPASAEAFLLDCSELSESTARRRASTLRFWWHALFLPARPAGVPAAAEIAGLPAGTHALFDQLLRAPLADALELLALVDQHVKAFRRGARTNEFLDWEEAQQLGAGLRAAHDRLASDDAVARRLWQAAARYFLVVEDADADFDIGGVDDDLAVFNAVVRHLGHPDLVLRVP